MFTVTDTAGESGTTTTTSAEDLVEAIRGWFPDPPAEITSALTRLEEALRHREYTGELEAYLGIRITADPDRISGGRLRHIRTVLGLSGQDLAGRLHVRPDTIRRWESGRDAIPYRVANELADIARERVEEIEHLMVFLPESSQDSV